MAAVNLDIARIQIQMTQARITYWSTYVNSGMYKIDQKGKKWNPETKAYDLEYTDDENLKHAMGILHNHMNILYETTEFLISNLDK